MSIMDAIIVLNEEDMDMLVDRIIKTMNSKRNYKIMIESQRRIDVENER